MNDINKKSGTAVPSVISVHCLQEHYDFDWNVHILDNEPSWFKRIISVIHIKIQSCELNKQSDTEMSDFYTPIIYLLNSDYH